MTYEQTTYFEEVLGYDPELAERENHYDEYAFMYSTFDSDDYEYQQDLASGHFGCSF